MNTIFAKLLIGLLVVSFAVWGVSGFVNPIDPSEVARAGDTPVGAAEFARVYERYRNDLSQRMGTGITPDQAQAMGLPSQVLSELVREALQVDAANALGVDVSDEEVAERIRSNPVFAGPNGSFDRNRFDRLLSSNRMSEGDFVALERRLAAQEMLVNGLVGGMTAPVPYLQAFNRYANQTREVATFTLTEDVLDAIPDPSEEELRAFHADNTERFRSSERRSLSLVTLAADALADPGAVSDDDIRRGYDAPGAYGAPERRAIQQIPMASLAAAEEAAAALDDGAELASILVPLGRTLEDVDLGTVARSALVDADVAEAAFALEAPGTAAVESRFGPILVRVPEIVPAEKRPFEDVEEEIRNALAIEEAERQVQDVFTDIEDAVAGGARASEVADRFGLPLRTIPAVAADGTSAEDVPVDIDAAILDKGFAEELGDDPARVDVGEAIVWVQVDGIDPAADQPFEAVSGDVLANWTGTEKAERLAALAGEAVAALSSGTPIDEVAGRYGVATAASAAFSRNAPPENLPNAVAQAAFGGPAGFAATVADEAGQPVVFVVTNVSEPVFFEGQADLQDVSRTLDEGIASAIVGDLVDGWQQEVGATVNQPVLDRIVGIRDDRG